MRERVTTSPPPPLELDSRASQLRQSIDPVYARNGITLPLEELRTIERHTRVIVLLRVVLGTILWLLAGGGTAAAQQLAIRWYDTADGLASSNVTALKQDSRGYLWIATLDGLSRFDGTSFVNYRAPDDLSQPVVWTVAEDPQGQIWIGTNGQGVARLNGGASEARRRFDIYRVAPGVSGNAVDAIAFDRRGRLWCVSDLGLYRADPTRQPLTFQRMVAADGPTDHDDVYVETPDHLWFAMGRQLIEVKDDRILEHPLPAEYSRQKVAYLGGRPGGGVVAALQTDVLELTTTGGRDAWHSHSFALTNDVIESLAVAADGSLWVGTAHALIHEGAVRQRFDKSSGIAEEVTALAQDRGGRLWIGTRLGGVGRLSTHAVVAFTPAVGLPNPIVSRVVEGSDGGVVAATWAGPVVIRGDRVERVPLADAAPFDGIHRRLVTDRFGHWWIGTSDGLFFVAGPALDLRRAIHVGASYGLPRGQVFDGPGLRVVGDTLYAVVDETVYRAHIDANGPSRFEYVSAMRNRAPLDLITDASGRLWMATFFGLAWQPPHAHADPVAAGVDLGLDPRAFLRDSRGALWLGMRSRGLAVTPDPAAPQPTYRILTTKDGLSSDTVWSIADAGPCMYLATGRGVDRLDRESGKIDNLFAIDGLAAREVYHVMVDSRERVWAATSGGVVRFDPPLEVHRLAPPSVYIVSMRLNGQELAVPPRGTQQFSAVMAAPRSDLSIEFAGVDVDRTEPTTFEYRLEGVDAGWSPPTPQRVVSYPRLPPGRYPFEVRSITRDGRGPIAVVALDVRPALWQRWWFLALALGALVAAALAVQRVRLGRVIALERVRRQIASDLHDDLGSGLAQIAVLAEVAQRDRMGTPARTMADVADIARTLRSSVGDIVWAVDPRHDHLSDVVSRMRELAVSGLEPQGITVSFDSELPPRDVPLPPDRRRHLLLLFKEAVANIVRHAAARRVTVDVRARSGSLVLLISDDGRGFDAATVARGNGLDNLQARARALGGRIRIQSAPGRGTRIEAECPI